MEIKEYLRQKKRMCDYYRECKDCPLYKYDNCEIDSPFVRTDEDVDDIINTVVGWNNEHPISIKN